MPKLAGINHQAAIKALRKAGFEIVRQSGHVILKKGDAVVVVPRANPISAHTMGAIIHAAGLTIEQFKELL